VPAVVVRTSLEPCQAGPVAARATSFLGCEPAVQSGNANAGQGEGGLRCASLGFPVQQFASDALELEADGQVAVVEVDVITGQA
jgi:hypothetical protein